MLPHLMGAFSPEYEPGARGAFYGVHPPPRQGTLRPGRARSRRLHAAAQPGAPGRLRGRRRGRYARMADGARSALWNQIKADTCGLPVVTLQGEDAAIRGDAMLAGVAAGVYPDLRRPSAAMVEGRRSLPVGPDGASRLRRGICSLHPALRGAPTDVLESRGRVTGRGRRHVKQTQPEVTRWP